MKSMIRNFNPQIFKTRIEYKRDLKAHRRKSVSCIFVQEKILQTESEQIRSFYLDELMNTYSINTYVLLHFEHKDEVITIVKLLYTATSRRQVAL